MGIVGSGREYRSWCCQGFRAELKVLKFWSFEHCRHQMKSHISSQDQEKITFHIFTKARNSVYQSIFIFPFSLTSLRLKEHAMRNVQDYLLFSCWCLLLPCSTFINLHKIASKAKTSTANDERKNQKNYARTYMYLNHSEPHKATMKASAEKICIFRIYFFYNIIFIHPCFITYYENLEIEGRSM